MSAEPHPEMLPMMRRRRKASSRPFMVSIGLHAAAALVLSVVIIATTVPELGFIMAAPPTIIEKPKPVKRRTSPPRKQQLRGMQETPTQAALASTTVARGTVYGATSLIGTSDQSTSSAFAAMKRDAAVSLDMPIGAPRLTQSFAVPTASAVSLGTGSIPTLKIKAVAPGLSSLVMGTPGNGRVDELRKEFLAEVHARLSRVQAYPRAARERGIEGTVRIEMTVRRDGTVQDVEISHSSGSALLDQAALASIRQVVPLPPLPDVYSGDMIRVEVPISFRLMG